ncbi:MAG: HU family DNA-binding protein [Bacteroidota bacterium]|jgi:DNA-binding protein HU-beta
MTKAEIVSEISKNTGILKPAVEDIVNTFMSSVKQSMIKGENCYFRGFGSFIVKKRAQKTARNLSLKKPLVLPAHFTPKFKPARDFASNVSANVAVRKG